MKTSRKTLVFVLAFLMVLPIFTGIAGTHALAAGEVRAVSKSDTELEVSWEAYPNAVYYMIYFSNDPNNFKKYTITYEPYFTHRWLTPNQEMFYKVVPNNNRSANMLGSGTPGAPAADDPAPSDAKGMNAVIDVVGFSELELSWEAVEGYEDYCIWKHNGSNYELVKTTSNTYWMDDELEPGTEYKYAIGTEDKAYYQELSATTKKYEECPTECDDKYPVVNLVVSQKDMHLLLEWNDIGAGEYYVLKSDDPYRFDWFYNRIATIKAGQPLSYLDTDVNEGEEWWYLIETDIKSCCNSVMGVVEEPQPDPELHLTVSNSASDPYTSLQLDWTDDSNATSYDVYRSTDGSTWGSPIATTPNRNHTDSGLKPGTTYYYKVVANTGIEDTGEGTTKIKHVLTLTVTNNSMYPESSLDLSWTDTSNATAYTIYRSTNGSTWGSPIASNYAQRNFTDTGLNANTKYFYKVVSNTNLQDIKDGTTKVKHVLTLTVTNNNFYPESCLNLTWTDTSNATAYTIYRSTNGSTWGSPLASNYAGRSYIDTGLNANTKYFYKVVSNTNLQDIKDGTTKIKPAINLSVYTISSSQLMPYWTTWQGTQYYKLERSLYKNGPYTNLGNFTSTYRYDTGLKANTTYWYRVTAYPSGAQAVASGKTLPETTKPPVTPSPKPPVTPTPTPIPSGSGAPDFWLTAGSNEETVVRWSWKNLSKPHPQYNIYISESENGSYKLVRSYRPNVSGAKTGELYYSINQVPYNPQNLVNGKKYFIKMSVTDSSGKEGPMSKYSRYFYAFKSTKKEGFGTPPDYHYKTQWP